MGSRGTDLWGTQDHVPNSQVFAPTYANDHVDGTVTHKKYRQMRLSTMDVTFSLCTIKPFLLKSESVACTCNAALHERTSQHKTSSKIKCRTLSSGSRRDSLRTLRCTRPQAQLLWHVSSAFFLFNICLNLAFDVLFKKLDLKVNMTAAIGTCVCVLLRAVLLLGGCRTIWDWLQLRNAAPLIDVHYMHHT